MGYDAVKIEVSPFFFTKMKFCDPPIGGHPSPDPKDKIREGRQNGDGKGAGSAIRSRCSGALQGHPCV